MPPCSHWKPEHKALLFFTLMSVIFVLRKGLQLLWPIESYEVHLAVRRHSRQTVVATKYGVAGAQEGANTEMKLSAQQFDPREIRGLTRTDSWVFMEVP